MNQDDHPHPPDSYFATPDYRAYVADRLARGWTVTETPGVVSWSPPPRPPGRVPPYGWWSIGWDCQTRQPYDYHRKEPNP